jgi:2-polyprenyl-3-methyl-5-hydroxy-6-metoxy-1,4-benzoquinol methylase
VKPLDRLLQRWRIRVAADQVPGMARLLDVGCADGVLLERLAPRLSRAVGIDPHARPNAPKPIEIVRGEFPGIPRFASGSFDCVTLLAVIEHVAEPEALARECHRVLSPGGRVVLTVPHPFVDRILDLLIRVRLLDGMEAEQHHGFDSGTTRELFERAGFRTRVDRRFQLGLNRLLVFERPE